MRDGVSFVLVIEIEMIMTALDNEKGGLERIVNQQGGVPFRHLTTTTKKKEKEASKFI